MIQVNSQTIENNLSEVIAHTKIHLNKYIPHSPTPKQHFALLYNDKMEGLYGGAAGGGKSDFLLIAGLQYVDYSDYNALILRRTSPELSQPGGLMYRARQWLAKTDAQWSGKTDTWTFPSGATLTFGHMQYENDKHKYDGGEYTFIGFDELTSFTKTQYEHMFERKRKSVFQKVPTRIRATGTPINEGYAWVRDMFIPEYCTASPDKFFVPATLDDNPYVDKEDYIKGLSKLDPITLEKVLRGDWSVQIPGEMFRYEWFQIGTYNPKDVIKKVRFWDLACTEKKKGNDPDWAAGSKVVKDGKKDIFIDDIIRVRATPANIESLIFTTAKMDGKDTEIHVEEEGGSAGKMYNETLRKQLRGYVFKSVRHTGSKASRLSPMASAIQKGIMKMCKGEWNLAFVQEAVAFPNGAHDDMIDSSAGGLEGVMDAGSLHQRLMAQEYLTKQPIKKDPFDYDDEDDEEVKTDDNRNMYGGVILHPPKGFDINPLVNKKKFEF